MNSQDYLEAIRTSTLTSTQRVVLRFMMDEVGDPLTETISISQQELAIYTGLTRRTVRTAQQELERMGWLTHAGRDTRDPTTHIKTWHMSIPDASKGK